MVINEFFKSIFRTLGRITAYIILGILAYLIFSWFGFESSKVKAQTLTPTSMTAYGLNTGGQSWQQNFYNVNSFTLTQNSSTHYYINGVNQYFTYALNNQTYLIDIVITFTTYVENMPTSFTNVIQFNGVNATCDSTPNQSIIQTGASTYNYTYQYRYSCYIDNTTSGSSVYYNWYNGSQQTIKTYTINFNLGTNDKENADIIAANNANTDKIINNQNYNTDRSIFNWNQNTDKIINSNSQTQQAVNNNTQAIEDLEDSLTDESDADISILSGIQDLMPSNTPVTDIITLPISILNKEIQSLGGSCSPWTINTGQLLGNNTWTFPCINIGQYFTSYSYSGYNLWQLIDLMICLFMGYEILMLIISSYNGIANLDDSFVDLYTPRHASGGYTPRHAKE